MSTQPEALRLAAHLEELANRVLVRLADDDEDLRAAAELRRLHHVNAELLAALNGVLLWGTNTNYERADAAVTRARAAIQLATPAPSTQEGK